MIRYERGHLSKSDQVRPNLACSAYMSRHAKRGHQTGPDLDFGLWTLDFGPWTSSGNLRDAHGTLR